MTALKKTVRTRRGVEPTGRPARREVELGKRSTNELVQDVLCDFFDSQRGLAPPGRVRGAGAAREGSGALGEAILRIPSRWRRLGPVARGARGGHIDALGPLQVHVSHYGWRRREVRGVGARHGHDDGVDGVGVGGVRGPTASTGHEAPADVALLWLATPTPSSGPPAGRRSPRPRRTRRGTARWPCGARGSARPRSTPVADL
jgi:hypothetical protein